MKKMLKAATCLIMVLGLTSAAFAAATHTITVKATIPTLNGMTVTLSKVVGTTFTTQADNTLMDFGTLTFDTVNSIFTAAYYFALDIGVLNNAAWTVQHTPSTIYNRTTGNTAQKLDSNINVSFFNQLTSTTANNIAKVSFLNSARTVTSTNIATGWLRIYYGIGTGDPANPDNTGVTPILSTQPAGNYQGSVTLSLTP